MEIFISWSGPRSKAIAKALNDWMPKVIQGVKPWMSPDIPSGARWQAEIADRLDKNMVGVVCLTPENLNAPWLLFEAGALSKHVSDSRVCTYYTSSSTPM